MDYSYLWITVQIVVGILSPVIFVLLLLGLVDSIRAVVAISNEREGARKEREGLFRFCEVTQPSNKDMLVIKFRNQNGVGFHISVDKNDLRSKL